MDMDVDMDIDMSRREWLATAGIGSVGALGLGWMIYSCGGGIPNLNRLQEGERVTVGGRVQTVSDTIASLEHGTKRAFVSFEFTQEDDLRQYEPGDCMTDVTGTVSSSRPGENIVFVRGASV